MVLEVVIKPFLGEVSKINDYIYLSSIFAVSSSNIIKYKIDCVITVCKEGRSFDFGKNVEIVRVDLIDSRDDSVPLYFDILADKLNENVKNKKTTLVHCIGGINRSPSIILAYYMKYQGKTLREAHDYVKTKRKFTRPNPGYWKQLILYEKELTGKNTVTLKDVNGVMLPDVYNEGYDTFGGQVTHRIVSMYSVYSEMLIRKEKNKAKPDRPETERSPSLTSKLRLDIDDSDIETYVMT